MEVPILKLHFTSEDITEISLGLSEALAAGQLALGPRTLEFERLWAEFCRTRQAVSVANGTAALEMIYRALDVKNRLVAVPANTYMATALAAVAAGAKVLFIDCDPVWGQMCPDDLAAQIDGRVKVVSLVHLGGFISPRLAEIKEICRANGSVLIEDAAHAHGAEINGHRAGSLGMAAAFSFFPTKVLTTAEGGMVTTSNEELALRLRSLRQHGQRCPGSNTHEDFGLNYRPSEIHALLGLVMMRKAEALLAERRRLAARYDQLLARTGTALELVPAPTDQKPSYYKYPALLPQRINREELKATLRAQGINLAGEVYARPIHRQPLWANRPELTAGSPRELPAAERLAERQICLPLYPGLSEAQQDYVAAELIRGLAGAAAAI